MAAVVAAVVPLGLNPAAATQAIIVNAGDASAQTNVPWIDIPAPNSCLCGPTGASIVTCVGRAPAIRGAVLTGSYDLKAKIGSISGPGTNLTGCTGPKGEPVKLVGIGAWRISVAGFAADGSAQLQIGKFQLQVATPDGTTCSFAVNGSVLGSFTNSTETLGMKDTKTHLAISNVKGCSGEIESGPKTSFRGSFSIHARNPAYDPISITGA